MEKTFLFYDIETSGLNKAFDQVLQFAAIRTNAALEEIERHEWFIKLNPDVIPSPRAMLTHQLRLQDIQQGHSEFLIIKKIHELLNTPGTISVGYNSLGFDDEFLRFSFYRNLLPPYTHQYANHCGRLDIYPLTILYFLFQNSILKWPTLDNKISLKLESLNAANALSKGRAHHAMADVEATLHLAQKFYTMRKMWDYSLDYFNKNVDQTRMSKLSIALAIDGFFGSQNFFQAPVLLLGKHKYYTNQTLWLRMDLEDLSHTSSDRVHLTEVIRKKYGEPSILLPYEERFSTHLSSSRKQCVENNLQWLKENEIIFKAIQKYHTEFQYPTYPDTDLDARLYLNGFWNFTEENLCRHFHANPPEKSADILMKMTNPTLKSLTLRILGRHFPEHLSEEGAKYFTDYMQKINAANEEEVLIDFQGRKRLTPKIALEEIALLQNATLSSEESVLLEDLKHFLTTGRINGQCGGGSQ